MSYEGIPAGELVAVVTFLEMHRRPVVDPPTSHLRLLKMSSPDVSSYRKLFALVGAPWLWFSRLIMEEEKLEAIINDPEVEVFRVVDQEDRDVGLVELDFREKGACELAFIGLVTELSGMGHGKWLLGEAVQRAWRPGVARVHVHTCSLDHPAALKAYRNAGFTAFERAVERFPDPRLLGILPRDCAPQIPLIA